MLSSGGEGWQISSYGQFRRYIWEITAQCDAWFSALYKYSYLLTCTSLMHCKGQFVRATLCYVTKLLNGEISIINLKTFKLHSETPAFETGGIPFPYSWISDTMITRCKVGQCRNADANYVTALYKCRSLCLLVGRWLAWGQVAWDRPTADDDDEAALCFLDILCERLCFRKLEPKTRTAVTVTTAVS